MAAAIYCHGRVKTIFTWDFQSVAEQGSYLGGDSGLCSKPCDPLDVRGNAGDSRNPRAKFLCPKDGATTKTAADVEHLSAESGPRAPDLGRVVQRAFLRAHHPLPKHLRS